MSKPKRSIMGGVLPNYRQVRQLITTIPEKKFKVGCMFGYVIAGRVSEIVAKAYPSDKKTTPNGPYGGDFEVADYEGTEVLVLHVKTSKREGLPRDIGVPLEKEPFAKTVLKYFQGFDANEPVFDYYRQNLNRAVKEVFKGYVYPIEPYTIRTIDQEAFQKMLLDVPEALRSSVTAPASVVTETKNPRHFRPLALHGAMRHYRIMELAQRYGLTKEERDLYTGHKTSGSDDRYSHLNWRHYFHKLLK